MKLGFCAIFALILILFKLIGELEISWFWALAPIWVGYGVMLLFFAVLVLGAMILAMFGGKEK